MTAPWPHGDPDALARAIVADPRFGRGAPAEPAPSWWDLVLDWLGGLLRQLLHAIDRALGARNPFDSAIGCVVIAAALALVGYGVYVLIGSFARAPRAARAERGAGGAPADAPSAAALRAAALAAAHARRYRAAAALLFASAARALDERGRLPFDPARTPGEYRRLVRDPVFDTFAGDTVVALFAAAEPPRDLFERLNATYERFFDPSDR